MPAIDGTTTGILMAVTGLIATAGGVILSRIGQRDSARSQNAATRLAERVQGYEELVKSYDRLEAQLKRADDELAAMRIENDRRTQAQAERCRAALASAMDTIHVLQQVVRDEIAKAAAADASADIERHTRYDH